MTPHKSTSFHLLKKKFLTHHNKTIKEFKRKHKKLINKLAKKGVSLVGSILLTTAILGTTPSELHPITIKSYITDDRLTTQDLIKNINYIVKNKVNLSTSDENNVADILSRHFKLKLKPTLQNNRLNEIYGYIGAEQHLYRWPGDSLAQHDMQRAGIAPLKGSFGYFDNAEQEKYYVAVQLHELPNWNNDWVTLKPWYRYRKMFVYNPDNGKAIIAVIGDSGPSKFTGKTFGGSPEVMAHLERVDGGQKGKVIILFIDDPNDTIALGPIDTHAYAKK